MPNLSTINITAPPVDEQFVSQPGKHGAYFKAFPAGGAAVTSVADVDDYSNIIIGALPFSSTTEAAELIALSGKRLRGDRTTTAENQTFQLNQFLGQAKHARLFDRSIGRKSAPNRGESIAFLRVFPDDIGVQATVQVEDMVPEGDPGADAYLWNVTISFGDFDWVDLRIIPTFTSKTPTSGATGTTITVTGTNLTAVTSVQFRSGSTVSATVSVFSTKTATSLAFAVPGSLTAGSYNVFLMYGANEVAAASFTVS